MIVQGLGGLEWKYRDTQENEWHHGEVPGSLFLDMIKEGRIKSHFIVSRTESFMNLLKGIMNISCIFQ